MGVVVVVVEGMVVEGQGVVAATLADDLTAIVIPTLTAIHFTTPIATHITSPTATLPATHTTAPYTATLPQELAEQRERDRERFLEELEEDPELRKHVNLYRDAEGGTGAAKGAGAGGGESGEGGGVRMRGWGCMVVVVGWGKGRCGRVFL